MEIDKEQFFTVIKTAIILALLIGGSFFIIKASFNPSVTGAVIGTQYTSNSIILGIFLFMLSLALAYYTEKRD